MKVDTVKWAGVDGGQFDSLDPARVPKNGWSRAFNFLPHSGKMNLRAGSEPFALTESPIGDPISCVPVKGLLNAPAAFADWALLVIDKTCGVALVNSLGAWGTKLTPIVGGSIISDEMPWITRQRNGIVYAVRRNSGGMKRIEGTEWTLAGRPTPTVTDAGGATAAWASGGSLTSNVFRVGYTYYDSATGYEGNMKEIPVSGTPGAGKKIAITGLETAPADVKYTHFSIYATQADGAIFYWVANVAKAVFTYDFGSAPTSTQVAPTRMGIPDDDAIGFEIWGERGWLITEKDLFYSDFGKIEGYSSIQNLPFNPDDNDEMTTVYGWGDYLVVAKRRAMVLLSGYDRTTFEQKLWTEMSGCVAPHSMRDCEGELVWLSEDGFCSAAPGQAPKLISNTTVRAALSNMDPEKVDLVVADTLPDLSLYVAAYPRVDGSWGGVAYNWKSSAWSEFEFPSRPRFIYTGFDATGAVRIFAVMSGSPQPYVLFEGSTDAGYAIEGELVSGAPDTGGVKLAGVSNVALLCAPTRYPVTVGVYRDGDLGTSIGEREVNLRGDYGWKRILLPRAKLGTQLQVKVSYQGKDPFWIADMEWSVVSTTYERGMY